MNRPIVRFAILTFAALAASAPAAAAPDEVGHLKITVLATMLADGKELGEWGFSALVEVDGHRVLFDTGMHSDVVLRNAESLKIDLGTIPDVILSHCHPDHVGGLLTLRAAAKERAANALAVAHVGQGIFYPRHELSRGIDQNPMTTIKPRYEALGGRFVVHDGPVELFPGVWLTGPVPRVYPEHNWSDTGTADEPQGTVTDNLPEDMSLVCNTASGLVILTGCGHAGVINIVTAARSIVRPARVHALIGGIHLFNATDATLDWTAGKLNGFGVENFLGAHCTGVETVYRFRHDLHLDRAHAVVAAVGSSFELGKGIDPGEIAR